MEIDYKDLVQRLRDIKHHPWEICRDAADAIDTITRRVSELEATAGHWMQKAHESADQLVRFMLGEHSALATERDRLRAELAAIKSQEPLGHFQFDHLWGIHSEVQEQYKDDDGVFPLFARPVAPAQAQIHWWIDPNDKTQKKYLPWIGEKVLFAYGKDVFYGFHTGGSFQTGHGVGAKNFNTWACKWMPLPSAPTPKETRND